jgi:hypothetical protein
MKGNMKRFCGLTLRATGLVAVVIGVTFIVAWLSAEFSRGNWPYRLFGAVGIGVAAFGVTCRFAAVCLLRNGSTQGEQASSAGGPLEKIRGTPTLPT